ncbi:SDR family oxidoreductase [Salinispira pacifica]
MAIIDSFRLTDRCAVVTGGAGGIGAEIAAAFAEMGADVALLDLEGADANAERVRSLGRRALSIPVDVTNEAEVVDAFRKVEREFSRVDILFNGAGIVLVSAAEETSYEQWQKVVNVDLNAQFLVAREAARVMIRQGRGGSIINVASMSGHIVNWPQHHASYNAAKAGVIQLTRSLAVEWAAHNIRVNSISPGYVATPMTLPGYHELGEQWFATAPMKRLCRPEELAGLAVYLASDASSYVTGTDIVIDGGYSLV